MRGLKLLDMKAKQCLIFIILLTILICLYLLSPLLNEYSKTPIIRTPPPYNCCIPQNGSLRKNIFFLKTHKTGGSTLQNIILRFGFRNQLNFLLPIYYTYYLPFSENLLPFGSQTPDGKYNILASHMRYTSKLKSYMHTGTIAITILRNPATLFQSLYTYFRMHTTTGMTFQEFLKTPKKPKKIWSLDSIVVYRGYNQMSFDLGLETNDFGNTTAIDQFIRKIDNEFDFIMILEYFDASLVLLANVMGWPLEYVTYLKSNARPPASNEYVLTAEDQTILSELNYADTMLYNHFLNKFRSCIKYFGAENLSRKVIQLQNLNKKLKTRCVAEENNLGILGSVNYVPKNETDWECIYSTKLQIPFIAEITENQIYRLVNQSSKKSNLRTFR